MLNNDFGDLPRDELPFQSLEQPLLSIEFGNAESSMSSNEPFSCLISTSTDNQAHAGVPSKEFYQCRRCGRRFGRLDHVKRHCRSHVNERTYLCKLCSKSFNRKDLLDRHTAIHSSVSQNVEYHIKKRTRIAKACAQCIISKTKCSDERPCRRCLDRGQTCGPETEVSPPLPPDPSTQFELVERAPSSVVGSQPPWPLHGVESEPIALVSLQNQENLVKTVEGRAFSSLDTSLAGTQRNAESYIANGPDFSSIWDHNALSNDSALNIDDDILMAVDLDWNSLIQADYDFNYESSVSNSPHNQRASNTLNSASRPRAPLVQEFYKRSVWLWDPDPHDTASMEESPHLSEADERLLLSSGATEKAPEDKTAGLSSLTNFTCGYDSRDALLFLVQRNADATAAIRCFPTPKVLSFLLRAFVVQETVSSCPFLHLSSFKVSKCKPELLSALIIAGTANFANRHVWKLGLALQERTRLAIYKAIHHNNSISRDLNILQAHILWVEAGLWSGVRQRMEVARSAANIIPTMIREAGEAYHLEYHERTLAPAFEDDSETLRSKWAKWTELECFKRCVFRAFTNDIQGSVAYMRSPSFYSAEITFGLPAAHDLWAAPDASAWKAAYLAKEKVSQSPKLTLLDIIQDPPILQSLPQEYDCELSAFVALHCLWPQIVALQDTMMLHRGHRYNKKLPQNKFWLEAQRQDLYKRLADIRDTANIMKVRSDEARIVCELFMMALFVSSVELEKFVGRFGIEESRLTTLYLQTWSDGDEARYAMWHAGQILKAAQTVKQTQLRGFYAMAVYQACVVLALPLLLESTSMDSSRESPESHDDATSAFHRDRAITNTSTSQQANLIALNGPENMQIKTFLLTGQGNPALLLGDEVKALSNIEIIPSVIAKTFENNYPNTIESLPPMLEKLVALVNELTKLTRR